MKFSLLLFSGSANHNSKDWLDNIEQQTLTAQESGFDGIWGAGGHASGDGMLNTTLLLSRLSGKLTNMEFGALYLLPLENPVTLAEEIAALDVLTEGKLTIAVSLGWREFQFKAFGLDPKERLPRFLETLEIMKSLWQETTFKHKGRFYDLEFERGIKKPQQKPYPKILIAANADVGIKRSARIANGWLISTRAKYETIARQSLLHKAALAEYNTEGTIWAWRECYVHESKAKAIETIRPYAEALYADRASLGHARDLPDADRLDTSFDEIVKDRFIIGDVEECVEEIKRYESLGVESIIFRMQWPEMPQELTINSIKKMKEVIKHFR